MSIVIASILLLWGVIAIAQGVMNGSSAGLIGCLFGTASAIIGGILLSIVL